MTDELIKRLRDMMYRVSRNDAEKLGEIIAALDASTLAADKQDEFKNFHRLLCERFGYAHDTKDWRRDQMSLIEHIAARFARYPAAHSAGAQEPVAYTSADRLKRIAERNRHVDTMWPASMRDDGDIPLYTKPQPMTQTGAARDVLAERQRQIEVEGFSPTHDSKQTPGDLARAAACYAMHAAGVHTAETHPPSIWPRNWSVKWWKPDVSRRDLVKAAALILAEIERTKGE